MDVNCAVHVLQISSAQKWKNRHLKQCANCAHSCEKSLKCVTIFSTSIFFMFRAHLGPWLKCFRNWFRFRRDIRSQSSLRGLLHTAEIISTVCCTPRSQSSWCEKHRRDNIRDVQHTAELATHTHTTAHHGDKLHTAESQSKSSLVSGCF